MDTNEKDTRVIQVPIEDIIPNRFQPRLAFDDTSLQELANSIKQHGIIQPLVLRRIEDKYEIIAGERRYKAATMAGLSSVPAIITDMDDNKSAEVAIVENIQRKDLNAIEEARSYKALLDKEGMTQEELAKKMGISQAAISNKMRLLSLADAVQQALMQEKISERHARSLLKIKDESKQKALLKKIIDERMTVKKLEEEIKNMEENKDVEVPVIEGINYQDMLTKAQDITPAKVFKEETLEEKNEEKAEEPVVINPKDMYNTAEIMPNKFFNFLEDEAANMNFEEKPVVYEIPKEETNVQDEEIEMLDDFIIPSVKDNKEIEQDDFISNIIKTIRDLHLDSNKVKIEEINLPNEYHINIVIKKDSK